MFLQTSLAFQIKQTKVKSKAKLKYISQFWNVMELDGKAKQVVSSLYKFYLL